MSRVTKSYNYNAVCDVCGFEFKASELKQRWDGYMVCKDDWESRNILDFYRTRDDNHKLPWTRPNDGDVLEWTPVFSAGFTQTPGTGTITITGTYSKSTVSNTVNWKITITITGNATTEASLATVTVPITSSGGVCGMTTFQTNSVYVGNRQGTGITTVQPIASYSTNNNSLIMTGSYGL